MHTLALPQHGYVPLQWPQLEATHALHLGGREAPPLQRHLSKRCYIFHVSMNTEYNIIYKMGLPGRRGRYTFQGFTNHFLQTYLYTHNSTWNLGKHMLI